MEYEWDRVQRLRKEGKCKGGKYIEVSEHRTEVELEMDREKQRKYQAKKKKWGYFKDGLIKEED